MIRLENKGGSSRCLALLRALRLQYWEVMSLDSLVSGTSGIGEATMWEFVRYSVSPRVYLLGGSQEQEDLVKDNFCALNLTSDV